MNPSKRKAIRREPKRFTRTRIHFPRCENGTLRFASAVRADHLISIEKRFRSR